MAFDLRELLARPPGSKAELDRRLKLISTSPLELQMALVDLAERGSLEDEAAHRFFSMMGVAEAAPRLRACLADPTRPIEARRLFLSLLELAPQGLEGVARDAWLPVAEVGWRELLTRARDDPSAAAAFAESLSRLRRDDRDAALVACEKIRLGTQTAAAVAYQDVLRSNELAAQHKHVLAWIVEESRVDDIELLETLLQQARRKPVRKELQRAIAARRAKQLGPTKTELRGRAFVSPSDGACTFMLVICLEDASRRFDLLSVSIEGEDGLGEGDCEIDRSNSQLERFVEFANAAVGVRLVELPFPEAVRLVHEAVERSTGSKRAIPEEVRPFVNRLLEAEPGSLPGDALIAAADPREATFERLMLVVCTAVHDPWYFDEGDFLAEGLPMPTRFATTWLPTAEARLSGSERIRRRLLVMTRQMASWYSWRGDQVRAKLMASAHRSMTDPELRGAPLIRAMLYGSLDAYEGSALFTPVKALGQPDYRGRIRTDFFSSVSQPTSLDLARLDLMEVAQLALDQATGLIPGAQPEQLGVLAREAADSFSSLGRALVEDHDLSMDSEHFEMLVRRCVRLTGLPAERVQDVLTFARMAIVAFAESVCALCPVACLRSSVPTLAAEKLFFEPTHPAASVLKRLKVSE
ncbi:MAG: hypothetical protein HY791_21490 [Deltaproteobacteria bacterium]|nr:hypothetical protein [Deltaproteobacteria bacterium]